MSIQLVSLNKKQLHNNQEVIDFLLDDIDVNSIEEAESLLGIEFALADGSYPSDEGADELQEIDTTTYRPATKKSNELFGFPESYPAILIWQMLSCDGTGKLLLMEWV